MAATAKEQSLETKPTMLAVVFVLLALFRSSISLLDAVYIIHLSFGATIQSLIADHLKIFPMVNVKEAISARNTSTEKRSSVSSSL